MAWDIISDIEHDYSFRVPNQTPDAQDVEIDTHKQGGTHRVHVHSADEYELYFEVVSYPGHIDHKQAYDAQREHLVDRFDDAKVTDISPTQFKALPATGFRFEGGGKVRQFLFVDSTVRTYRLVYNPLSRLNEGVLATFTLGSSKSVPDRVGGEAKCKRIKYDSTEADERRGI